METALNSLEVYTLKMAEPKQKQMKADYLFSRPRDIELHIASTKKPRGGAPPPHHPLKIISLYSD